MWYSLAAIILGVAWYLKAHLVTTSCRCVPGSNSWPSLDDWNVFNNSVNGRAFVLRPVGWPCSPEGYDHEQCQEVVRQFHNSSWRAQHVGMAMSFFAEKIALTRIFLTVFPELSGIPISELGGWCDKWRPLYDRQ